MNHSPGLIAESTFGNQLFSFQPGTFMSLLQCSILIKFCIFVKFGMTEKLERFQTNSTMVPLDVGAVAK